MFIKSQYKTLPFSFLRYWIW